jgi:hypothetical protein
MNTELSGLLFLRGVLMQTDLTFITNEPGSTLFNRFRKTLKDVWFFDVLVGYFRTGVFHKILRMML